MIYISFPFPSLNCLSNQDRLVTQIPLLLMLIETYQQTFLHAQSLLRNFALRSSCPHCRIQFSRLEMSSAARSARGFRKPCRVKERRSPLPLSKRSTIFCLVRRPRMDRSWMLLSSSLRSVQWSAAGPRTGAISWDGRPNPK